MLWVLIRITLPRQFYWVPKTNVFMTGLSTHYICFYGELTKIILELSSNTLLICSSENMHCKNILPQWSEVFRQIGLEEQSDRGLHCLPFCLHLLEHNCLVQTHTSNIRIVTAIFSVSAFFRFLRYMIYIWAMSRENLSLAISTRYNSNQPD